MPKGTFAIMKVLSLKKILTGFINLWMQIRSNGFLNYIIQKKKK